MLKHSLLMGGAAFTLWSFAHFSPDDAGGAGAGGVDSVDSTVDNSSTGSTDAATLLFGGETKAEGEGEKPATIEWKEYENDASKTDEENAVAKAEHDKTRPAEEVDPAGADAVPSDGKYELTVPEGMELDAELVSAVSPILAGKGFTRAEAQELSDAVNKVYGERAAKDAEDWQNTVSGWADTAKKDKEIGGDKWDGTVLAAQKAVTKLGNDGLREYLNASGGGNHPELIRFFAKVGGMISDDNTPTGGSGGAGKPVDASHLMFPSDAPKA